jgi:gas vesicle protein
MSRRDQNPGSVITFILGVTVGAVAALLLAPKAGKELRQDLAEGMNDGMEQLRSAGKDLKQRAGKFASEAQDNVQDALEAGQKAYRQAKA